MGSGKMIPENLFKNQNCFLVCNGPSLTNYNLDLLNLTGILTMGMNNGPFVYRPKLWTAQDYPRKFLPSIWEDPTILKFVPEDNKYMKYSRGPINKCPNIIYHKRKNKRSNKSWLNTEEVSWQTGYNTRNSVMISALHILFILGIRNVYILGSDLKMTEKQKYCFDEDANVKANNRLYKGIRLFLADNMDLFTTHNFFVWDCGDSINQIPQIEYYDAIKESVIETEHTVKGMYHGNKHT